MPNNAWRTDWHTLLKYHKSLFSIAPAGAHLTFGTKSDMDTSLLENPRQIPVDDELRGIAQEIVD